MIYFDNAATSGVKPEKVISAVTNTLRYLSANPGRSGHSLSVSCAQIVETARERTAEYFGFRDSSRVVFTKNCTEALNAAILGTVKEGGHVITTANEHNSVLRPLFELHHAGIINVTVVKPGKDLTVSPKDIEREITPETYLIAASHMSNVTGAPLDVAAVGEISKKHGLLFLLDAAQSAGHERIEADDMGVDMAAFAGHKGLYAPQGTGGLCFSERAALRPVMFGGTGTDSQSVYQPTEPPEAFESGTLNTPGIAGLSAGIDFVEEHAAAHGNYLAELSRYVYDSLRAIPGVTVRSLLNKIGLISFETERFTSSDVADILNSDYNIAVRSGLHCAPLIHEHLGTTQNGLTRVSLSPFNTRKETDRLIYAVRHITAQKSYN